MSAISNEIFKAVTGEAFGHFDSQILYVSESGPITKRVKRINIIDFDAVRCIGTKQYAKR